MSFEVISVQRYTKDQTREGFRDTCVAFVGRRNVRILKTGMSRAGKINDPAELAKGLRDRRPGVRIHLR